MSGANATLMSEPTWHGKAFDGSWRSLSGGTADVLEPATGEVLTKIGIANPDDVKASAKRAFEVQPAWAATSFETRIAIMRRVLCCRCRSGSGMRSWPCCGQGLSRRR